MTTFLAAIFWLSVALIGYALFLYPLILKAASFFGRATARRPDFLPTVSVLVPFFNEERVIAEKLANCLELDYPPDRLEIVFASDGSTDGSLPALRKTAGARVKVLEFPANRGKVAVLNEVIPQLKGDIVVLSDASGSLSPSSVRAIAQHFNDPDVGCVCGFYRVAKEGRKEIDTAEGSYHGMEMLLRYWEGRIWTTLSGTGALCAIRRAEYVPLPEGVINEDFLIPARIALAGRRVIYEPSAHVIDHVSTSWAGGFSRRVRIAYGNWQQIGHLKSLFAWRRPYLAWVFFSHKLIRMAFPLVLLVALATSLAVHPLVFLVLVAGMVSTFLVGMGMLLWPGVRDGQNPLAGIPLFYLNAAAVAVGTYRYFSGQVINWRGEAVSESGSDARKVKDHFERTSSAFDTIYSGDKPWLQRTLDRVFRRDMYDRFRLTVEECGDARIRTVLDVGTGSGRFCLALAPQKDYLLGIDFSESMVALAREQARKAGVEKRAEFKVGDFMQMSFDRTFDAILAIGLFDYIREPGPFLSRMRGLLSQKLVATFPSVWTWRMPIRWLRLNLQGCPVYFFTRRRIEALLKEAGLRLVRFERVGKIYFVVAEPEGPRA